MKKSLISVLSVPLYALAFQAYAADIANGKELATKKYACLSCHGENMNRPIDPSYPKLGGQYADYLAQALLAYQRGAQPHAGRNNAIMAGQAKPLSRKEIADISAYIASLPGELRGGR